MATTWPSLNFMSYGRFDSSNMDEFVTLSMPGQTGGGPTCTPLVTECNTVFASESIISMTKVGCGGGDSGDSGDSEFAAVAALAAESAVCVLLLPSVGITSKLTDYTRGINRRHTRVRARTRTH